MHLVSLTVNSKSFWREIQIPSLLPLGIVNFSFTKKGLQKYFLLTKSLTTIHVLLLFVSSKVREIGRAKKRFSVSSTKDQRYASQVLKNF